MELFDKTLKNISGEYKESAENAKKYIDNLAKPLGSLGKLEDIAIKLAGITGIINLAFHMIDAAEAMVKDMATFDDIMLDTDFLVDIR